MYEGLIRVLVIETAVRAGLIYIQDCLYLYVVMRRQLSQAEGSLREVLTKRRYVLRIKKGRFERMRDRE